MTRQRWSAERHQAAGARLKAIRQEMLDVLCWLDDYPVNAPIQSAGQQALRRLDALRCKLDSAFGREHPAAYSPCVYYGAEPRLVPCVTHRCRGEGCTEAFCGGPEHCANCRAAGCLVDHLPHDHPFVAEAK